MNKLILTLTIMTLTITTDSRTGCRLSAVFAPAPPQGGNPHGDFHITSPKGDPHSLLTQKEIPIYVKPNQKEDHNHLEQEQEKRYKNNANRGHHLTISYVLLLSFLIVLLYDDRDLCILYGAQYFPNRY